MSGKELESKRKTAVVTDGKYRTSIAAVRALGRAGYRVVVTQTKADCGHEPPVFHSCFAAETVWLEGSAADRGYTDALFALLKKYDRPVLFCVGAVSLNAVSGERERFAQVCDFLIAPPQVLDDLNDKETVHRRCEELGIPVPCQYEGEPETYPVVIKPHCGEKFGLKAAERYAVANNREEYQQHLERMRRYDPTPIVQQKIEGDGMGVSLLLGADGELINALCHRRIREYPASGGPSTCCESFYDETMIEQACRLLKSFGFSGVAMVEFKGNCVLEVNPRVWGSFPMTERAGSSLVCNYARAAAGEKPDYVPRDYQIGVRMRFTLNDAAATLDYLRRGQIGKAFGGMADFFRVKEALSAADDPKPLRHYLRSSLLKR
jgi:predicted ATP-grasp superfamily ATP-dependent carboligase